MAKLYVIGIGPGGKDSMTLKAIDTIKKCNVIVGYTPYIEYIKDFVDGQEVFSTGMRGEIERCNIAIKKVKEGNNTAIISTGDAGLYGMAGPILELGQDIEVEIIPGVTSAFSAASELGAPIMHDFCTISLSDLLTPWDFIEKRIELASRGDFVIAIYNPRSKGRKDHLKKAVEMMLKHKLESTPVGIVKDSGRLSTEKIITTLGSIDYELVDMKTVIIVGNSKTYVENGMMITPRGYKI